MKHPIVRVSSFERLGRHSLRISFSDKKVQVIDFEPILRGQLFGPLQNESFFGEVKLDPESGTLVWPNGADFDPAVLYDWERCRDELVERAKHWGAGDNN